MNHGSRRNPAAALRAAVWVLLALFVSGEVYGQKNIRNDGIITNNGTATVVGYFENFKNAAGGTLINTGTYNIGSYFSNNNTGGADGTLTITAGTVTVTGNFTNDNGSTGVSGGTLKLSGATNANATPILFSITSTGVVDYSGAAQNVLAATYAGLKLSGSGNKTMDGSVTVNTTFDLSAGTLVVGANTLDIQTSTLTSTTGALSAASGTVSYTGAGTQQIFPATYGALSLSGTGAKTVAGGTPSITLGGVFTSTASADLTIPSAGTLTINAGATVTGNSGAIKAAGTVSIADGTNETIGGTFDYTGTGQNVAIAQYTNLTLTGSSPSFGAGSFLISGVLTPTSAPSFNASAILNFNGSGSQTIPALNYANITSSSSGARTLASSGTIGISGTFTPGTNSYTITSSTINFNNSTGGQTVPAFTFNNLTVSNASGTTTLVSSGTIGVAGTFTPGSQSYTITGSTIDFNSSGSQSIPAFNYNNLTSSSSGARTLVNGGTIGIAGTFTPGGNSYTITGNTIDYNSTTAQSIAAFTYNHLALTSGSTVTKSLSGTITVNGNLTVNTNNTLADAGYQITGNGSGTLSLAAGTSLTLGNSGTATLFPSSFINANITLNATSTVVYNSDQAQTISVVPTYGNLTLTATSSVIKTISGAATVQTNLTVGVNNTLSVPGAGSVQINSGDLIMDGTLQIDGNITIGL
jgi:hypothetical protein